MKRLRFVDHATLVYLGAVAALLVVARNRATESWPLLLAAHAAVGGGIVWLAWIPRTGFPGWFRELYPLPLFVGLYRESALLNRAVFEHPLDPWFLRAEQRWFGCQPSLAFAEHFPSAWIAEPLYAGYFSFYPMILAMGIWLVTHDRIAARRFIGILATVFYVCYAVFIVFPVVGPRIVGTAGLDPQTASALNLAAVGPMPESTQSGPFARLMGFLYDWFEGDGGAFPSSHVVVACLTLMESFRHRFRLRWWHAGAVGILCLGTVYGRYHYVVDVIAGLLVVGPLVAGAAWLQRRVDGGRPADDALQRPSEP